MQNTVACLKSKLIIRSKKVLFTLKQYNGLKKLIVAIAMGL